MNTMLIEIRYQTGETKHLHADNDEQTNATVRQFAEMPEVIKITVYEPRAVYYPNP